MVAGTGAPRPTCCIALVHPSGKGAVQQLELASVTATTLLSASAVVEEQQAVNGATSHGYQKPPPKVMICNRGEIARRVIRTANHHGLETVAIYTQVSTFSLSLCVSVCCRRPGAD